MKGMLAIRQAARGLWRTPGTAIAAVLTLALGIGASTVMFTLLHSLLLRPVGFPDAERLAAVEEPVSWGDALRWEEHAHTAEASGVYRKRTWAFTDGSQAPVAVVLAGMVTHGFFDALAVAPERGVPFAPSMEMPGANHVVWLAHAFWVRRYRAREDVLGTVVKLNDVPYRVAGVLPATFHFPMDGENADVWFPLDRNDYCCARDARGLNGIVRLRRGVARGAAAEELSAVAGTRLRLVSLQTALLGDRREPLLWMACAAGLLMLVAAANAAAMLLGRAARHARDAAVKASLGAQMRHLVREQIAQGLLIGSGAGLGGVALLWGALEGARRIPALAQVLEQFGAIAAIRVDARVVSFAVLLALVSAVGAALVPLWLLRSARLEPVLRRGTRGRSLLVIAQVALSTVLLATGALVVAHLRSVLNADKGFRTEQVVLAGIGIPEARYDTDAKMVGFHERVIENLARIPGVSAASGAMGMPLGGTSRFLLDGLRLPIAERPRAVLGVASPGMFELLGIPLVAGRSFGAEDRVDRPWVAVVNRRFVERYGKSVGARLRVGFWNGHMQPWTEFEVIGVAADARNWEIGLPAEPAIYLSGLQVPLEGYLYFVRTALPASALESAFQKAVWSVDRNIEAVHPRPLAPYVEASLESGKVAIALLGAFGGLALLLAAGGLGASVAGWVTESRKEIGIRAAVGATPQALAGQVVRRGAGMAGTGLLLGMPGAWAVSHFAQNRVFGLGHLEATPLVLVGVALLAVGVGASFLPARRAARMDPMEVLRRD